MNPRLQRAFEDAWNERHAALLRERAELEGEFRRARINVWLCVALVVLVLLAAGLQAVQQCN